MDLQGAHNIINDLWHFLKTYYCPNEDQAFWESLVNEADGLSKQHRNELMDSLLLCAVNDIEDRWKAKTGNPYRIDVVEDTYKRIQKRGGKA